jgi:ECF transporter S component (folate family)
MADKAPTGRIILFVVITERIFFMSEKANKPRIAIKQICVMAILIAMEIVLNRFLSINQQFLKIGFSFVPIVLAGVLLGPVKAAIIYGLADLIGVILFPTGPLMPGITFSCAMMGLVYGLFLKGITVVNNRKAWLRIISAVSINCILFGLILNSYWITLLYGTAAKGFYYFFANRLVEYAILIPTQIIIIPSLVLLSSKIKI